MGISQTDSTIYQVKAKQDHSSKRHIFAFHQFLATEETSATRQQSLLGEHAQQGNTI